MVKAKATVNQESSQSKKKALKQEVHLVKVVEQSDVSKKKLTNTRTHEQVESIETKLKGKKNKNVNPDTDVSATVVDTPEVNTKKKQRVPKPEKQVKLRNQVLNVDKNGLSIMPVRVRRMLLDVVFNQKNRIAEKELSLHKDALLEASNLKEGYLSYHGFSQETSVYLRGLVNAYVDVERTKYERNRVKALINASPRDENNKQVLPAQLQTLIENTRQFTKSNNSSESLTAVYQQYDKKFYKEFTEAQRIYNLTGEEAYKFHKSLVSRDKIRLNLSGNLKLTAFIELLLKQVVSQANLSCVVNGKTTLNLGNMVGAVIENNYLFPIVGNLPAWTAAVRYADQLGTKQKRPDEDVSGKGVSTFTNVEQLNPNNKFKFNSYIVDLCKNVSRSLQLTDVNITEETKNDAPATFSSVKISGEFKSLCNQLLLELLHTVGNMLKVIISTGKDRTVNSGTVDALIHTYHLAFNLTNKLGDTYVELNKLIAAYNSAQLTLRANKTTGTKTGTNTQ